MKSSQNNAVWQISLMILAFWMSPFFYTPILSAYARLLGGSLSMIGLIGGSMGLAALLLRLPIGIWSDRCGRRRPFLLAGFFLGLVSALVMWRAASPRVLLLGRLTAGVSTATYVALTVFVADRFPLRQSAGIMGMTYALVAGGQMAASVAGPYMARAWGWKAPFLAAILVSLAGLLLAARFPERGSKPPAGKLGWRGMLAAGKNPALLYASGLAFLVQFQFWVVTSFAPLAAMALGADKGDLGLLSLCNLAPLAAISMAAGRIRSLMGGKRAGAAGFVLMSAALLLAPFAGNLASLYGAMAVAGLGQGAVFPILMDISLRAVPPAQQGTAMGLFQSIYSIGVFLGPALTGLFAERYGLGFSLRLAGLLMAAGGILWQFRKEDWDQAIS